LKHALQSIARERSTVVSQGLHSKLSIYRIELMNKKESKVLEMAIVSLLTGANVESFQYHLKNLVDPALLNLRKKQVFDAVSDMLTTNRVINQVGAWVLAEVEGRQVQFSRLSEFTGPRLEIGVTNLKVTSSSGTVGLGDTSEIMVGDSMQLDGPHTLD
jgi:hypothetical protein